MPNKLLLVALAAVAPGAAQNTTLSGQVTNSITRQPIARAHVLLFNQSRKYGAYTDAAGNFSIQNVVPDAYQATAERMGFKTRVSMPEDDPGTLKLLPGAQHDSVRLELVPLGSVSGRVVDTNGEPMEGVSVSAQRGFAQSGQAKTDETGRFRIAGLVPGRFQIKAEKNDLPLPPEIRTDGTSEVHYALTWYPGVADAKSSMKVEVRPGSETGGLEIHMLAVPIVGIRGRIEGLPAGAKNVTVTVVQPGVGEASEEEDEVASNGRFEIWRLNPGHYRVSAMGNTIPGHDFQTIPEEVDIAGSNVDNLVLTVMPFVDINGRLAFEDAGTKRKLSKPGVVFNDVDGETGSRPSQMVDGESFLLRGLSASRYRVSVGEGVYVKSMRLGPTEINGSLLDLRHAPPGVDLVLTVSSTMGSVSGTVHDEKGAATRASVLLIPDDDQPVLTGSVSFSFGLIAPTKEDGTYLLDGIAPGKYKLVALDKSSDIDVSDYDDVAKEIEVRAGEKISKDVTRQEN
jgi:hypothetical protein